MPELIHRLFRVTLAASIAAIVLLAGTGTAHAGYYTAAGTCGLWYPYNANAR